VHFLHIGKTGGTAIKHAIGSAQASISGDGAGLPCVVHLHRHAVRLRDVPAGERFFFFVRDPLELTMKVVAGFTAAGGTLVRDEVVRLEVRAGRSPRVRCRDASYEADKVVIAAGAWSRLLGDHIGISLPLKPTRGQVMVLETYDRPLRRVVFGAGGYLAPKQDGRIVVGATEEDAGFERENTAGGVAFLVKILQRLALSLADTRVHHFGVGLRPTPPDGLPLLGPVAGRPGLWIAAGHHRNGILLAPITAHLMSNAIRKGDLAPLQPYAPERFAAP